MASYGKICPTPRQTRPYLYLLYIYSISFKNGRLYKMDDELTALLADAHQKLGFLCGLMRYAPNRKAFSELMLLKESTYSAKIDYKSASYEEVLYSCGTRKSHIETITNIVLAYEDAMSQQITNRTLSQICKIALYGAEAKKPLILDANKYSYKI